MSIIKALLAGLAGVSLCTAITISGRVTDTSGTTPISGAAVQLEKGGQLATTGADGRFTLGSTDIVTGQNNQFLLSKLSAKIYNGLLSVNIKERSAVEITAYTVQGKAIFRIQRTMDVGTHSIVLPPIGVGVYLYKVKSGNNELMMKISSLTGISGGTAVPVQGASPTALTRQAKSYVPINDVIAVTKAGYLNYRVIVTNPDTSGIEIMMMVCAGTVTDADGNVYQTVRIGNQVWTVENLRTTKYNDGSAISNKVTDSSWNGDFAGAYCYYNNTTNADSIKKYGALYNFFAVDTKKLAPSGWHVPTDEEWDTLQNYLIANGYNWDGTTTSNKIAKSLAAKTDWQAYIDPGTIGADLTKNNRSGFSALPGGYRTNAGGFLDVGYNGNWWSSTGISLRNLNYEFDDFNGGTSDKVHGFSVRLLKN
jgi:uncharacterized protein (TIGR02145 family)